MGQDSLLYRYVVSSLQPVPIRQRCYEKQPQLRQTYCGIPKGCRRFGRSDLATIEREENTLKQSSSSEEVDGKQRSTWLSVVSSSYVLNFALAVQISTRFSTQLWHTIHQHPLDELTLSSPCLPPLQPSRTHKCDSNPVKPPIPYPDDYQDKWNGLFVRMPCSPESVYPVYEEAILSYNYRFKSYWNFKTLEQLCMMNLIPDGGNDNFFGNTLSGICSLALNLPIFVTKPIPLLSCRKECALTLSQLQIASLLANALFCTFPRRNCHSQDAEYVNFPQINFSHLLSAKADSKYNTSR
ncbi:unnamed protein product [Schistosoma margrebowiei]|uniref:PARG helical domain-containing protein n=1 Tax=Schistosoma margrebowiei TaxID=48269 RepID=A0A183MYE5_9TREM|nr:unnamed protein product [Schistosoma margrebowiei]